MRFSTEKYREGLKAIDLCAGDLIDWAGSIYFVLKKDLIQGPTLHQRPWENVQVYFYCHESNSIIERRLERLICCEKIISLSAR